MAADFDSCVVFNDLSQKFTQLLYCRTQNERASIIKAFEELNSLNYQFPVVTNANKAALLISQCCFLIPPEDQELVRKCCQLITNLVGKQSVKIEGRTLSICVQWCLQGLKNDGNSDILIAIDALLRSNNKHQLISDFNNSAILSMAKNNSNPEITFLALQCLEACTCINEAILEKSSNQFEVCFKIFLDHLLNPKNKGLVDVKITTICLRGLQNCINQSTDLFNDNLGIILGCVKSYMLYGLKGMEFAAPQNILPSTLSIPEPPASLVRGKQGGKIAKQRKAKVSQGCLSKDWSEVDSYTPSVSLNVSDIEDSGGHVKTSDSDFSDTEGGNVAKLAVFSGRLRQSALSLFFHVVKLTEKNVMFAYWSSFIPENSFIGKQNLLVCILKDPSVKSRLAALGVLLNLLTSCKLYLRQAEKGDNSLSFTPFSVILGLMIVELHKCLALALKDTSFVVLVQVLKCFAALVQATPYHRLTAGLMSKVVRNVKRFVYNKEPTVQVLALIIIGCVLSSEPVTDETMSIFVQKNVEKPTATRESDDSDDETFPETDTELPWLLERCLNNLYNSSPAVKLESLVTLSAMARGFFEELLAPHLGVITKGLETALCDQYNNVRLHACHCVEFIGQAMTRHFAEESSKIISLELCTNFWQALLVGPLTALMQSESDSGVRALACDCLGSFGGTVFEQLPRDRQILCITLLFTCSRDEDSNVRGSAVRSLAIFILHPSLKEDFGFVFDTAEAIHRVLQDSNLGVRIKSSWALGNLSDNFVNNKNSSGFREELTADLMVKLMKIAIEVSRSNDKIKMNSARALGNFLQILSEDFTNQYDKLAVEAVDVLLRICLSSSNVKVRWNSCYALGNVLKNGVIFSTKGWQDRVFQTLSDLVINFRNFKVRISAALALASPTKRQFYDLHYQEIWIALAKALETSQTMEDFNEYKHRDHLVDQICLTIAHLISLLTHEDLNFIQNYAHNDYLKIQMHRVWERVLPEKSTVFSEARLHVVGLTSHTPEQTETLNCLKEILKHDY